MKFAEKVSEDGVKVVNKLKMSLGDVNRWKHLSKKWLNICKKRLKPEKWRRNEKWINGEVKKSLEWNRTEVSIKTSYSWK